MCLFGRRALVPALLLLALSLPWTRAALAGNEISQEKAYLPGMAGIALGVLGALAPRRLLGAAVSKWFSVPAERALRRQLGPAGVLSRA